MVLAWRRNTELCDGRRGQSRSYYTPQVMSQGARRSEEKQKAKQSKAPRGNVICTAPQCKGTTRLGERKAQRSAKTGRAGPTATMKK